jgi:hypothetical protein
MNNFEPAKVRTQRILCKEPGKLNCRKDSIRPENTAPDNKKR